jgi:RNA-directed DNA polymerase
LDADVRGAFDNISHDFILKTIGQIPGRELIKQWLKAGYVEAEMFHETESGTPQGGIVSPLLANIALDGIDELLSRYTKTKVYHSSPKAKHQKTYRSKPSPRYGFIRYADDFLVTAETKEDIEAIFPILKQWLQERGLELNEEKTRIVRVEEGVNFLGFTIRRLKGKCFTFPQKEKFLNKLREIREWLKTNKHASPEEVLTKLNSIIKGWGNYYRYGASKEMFSKFDYQLWRALWRWSIKRHPNKGLKWITAKYFKPFGNKSMIFTATFQDRREKRKSLAIKQLSDIPITRHIKVKGNASPDDPTLKEYWENRKTQYGRIYWAKGSKLYQVAENQNWECPVCGEHLFNGEELHVHHLTKVSDGGTDEQTNLLHLHKTCHYHVHSGKQTET